MIKAKAKAKLTFEVEFDISSDYTVVQIENEANDKATRVAESILAVTKRSWNEVRPVEIRFLSIDKKIMIEIE